MATTFIDGSAAGTILRCARAPMMLRVVVGSDGAIDALDQLTDSPREGESVFVYMMKGPPEPTGFWDGRDPKTNRRIGGPFASVAYKLLPDQPSPDRLRTRDAWSSWCEENREKLQALYREWCN